MNETQQNLPLTFSDSQQYVLRRLRARYEQDHDRFTKREWARLEFLRWLYQEGRPESGSGNEDPLSGGDAHPEKNPAEDGGDAA
jgi:hypothetical protein